MMVKVDFEKAYDAIGWNVVLANLMRMNFPEQWVSWIKTCILWSSFFLSN